MHLRLFFHHRFIPNPSSHYSFLVRDVSLSLPHCPAFFHSIFGKWFLLEGNFAGFPHYHPGQRNAGTRKALYSGGQGDSPRLPQENTTTCCFGFPSQVITRDTHPVGDTYMPHGGKSDQFCQLKYWYSELLKKKKILYCLQSSQTYLLGHPSLLRVDGLQLLLRNLLEVHLEPRP